MRTPLTMANDTDWHPTAFRTHTLGQIQTQGSSLVGSEVTVCGYMEANRGKGKICFMDLRDGTGKLQAFLKQFFHQTLKKFYLIILVLKLQSM